MTTLKDVLCAPETRPQVIDDTTRLIDDEVRSKKGFTGIAIKTAYKTVNAIKPTLVRDAVDNLLDRFVDRLEPFYTKWVDAGKTPAFGDFITGQPNAVANALLGVTDERAQQVENQTIKRAYQTLRPQGEKNVELAVPGLARIVSKYVS